MKEFGLGMLGNARLTVDLGKIEDNVRTLVSRLRGIDLVALTKGVCGSPEVARVMIAAGATALADSRMRTQRACARPA